ncbi:MAG: PVC-type heme-binding CxxCH protein, partial [Verrucomicrobiales bacterium]
IYVSQPPSLIVYTDVNRDLKFDPAVDKREELLTGFNARNHDHSLHSLTAGPDGKFYFNNGNCGAVFTDRSGKKFIMGSPYKGGGGEFLFDHVSVAGQRSDDGHVWSSGFTVRMNPDGTEAEIIGHGYRNSYEQSLTSFGDAFQNDNDDPPACRVSYILEYGSAGYFTRDVKSYYRAVKRPGQDHGRAHWRQDDPGTMDAGDIYGGGSPTGVTVYENGALGEDWIGSFFSCEPGRNTIFDYQPEPLGATFKLERDIFLTTNQKGEFAGSDFVGGGRATEEAYLFRPSDITVGPDGALYVTDWYDPRVGGHADLDDSMSGTIYRIAPKGFQPKVPEFDLKTIEGAITALQSPAINVRYLGFRALQEHGLKALPALEELLQHENRFIAARAIWLLPRMGEDGVARCASLLKDEDPQVRIAAYRALRRVKVDILPYAAELAQDADAGVRRDVALSLRDLPAERTKAIFATLAPQVDPTDKNAVEAIGLGAANQESEIWLAIKEAFAPASPEEWDERLVKLTWRLWPAAAVADLQARAASPKLSGAERAFAVESLAFIDDRKSVDAMLTLADESPVKAEAAAWLLKNGTGEWAKYDLRNELKKRGIYDPDKIEVTPVTVPAPEGKPKFSVAEVLKLTGDATRGAATAQRCIMCHSFNGQGPDYGPNLKGWGGGQPAEVIAQAIVEPTADLAHGYKGVEVRLKDGGRIHGLALNDGDPLIVTSTGGVSQMIPKKRIEKTVPFSRSLMLSADQLGLSAQDVADLVAYLKGY